MKYGTNMPVFDAYADPNTVAQLARDAEAAGWDGFFIWDHILFDPHGLDVGDPWVVLAAVAAATERIAIGTLVTPLPRRRPWVLARQAVSLDHLSHGRLVLGVGIGDPVDIEFGAFGEETDTKARARMLDEGLDIISGLWGGEPFSYEGSHYRLAEMRFRPVPVQTPRIPIWVAGAWPNLAPMRRASRWDGVVPLRWEKPLGPGNLQSILGYIGQFRTSSEPFEMVHTGSTPGDNPSRGAEVVAPFEAAGATWWIEDIGPERFRPFTYDASYVWPVEEMAERVRQGPPRG